MSLEQGTPTAIPALSDTEPSDDLSRNELFDLLRNRRRRDVLRYLLSVDRTVSLSELAEYIAALENDVAVEEVDSMQRKRVYVALYQTHLPKLDRANVLDYESGRGNVVVSERASELRPYLEDVPDGARIESGHRALELGVIGIGSVPLAYAVGTTALPFQLSLVFSLAFALLLVSLVSVHTITNT